MAFDLRGFQFARGVVTAEAQGSGVTSVTHSYKNITDTIATITTPGYFPDNIDGSTDNVFVDDLLSIVGSDSVALTAINSLAPFLLGADLYTSGPGLTVDAPIAPVDGNGILISGNVAKMEYATALQPGIVSTAAQSFGGDKTFTARVLATVIDVPNPVTSHMRIGEVSANPVTIGSTEPAHVPAGINIGGPFPLNAANTLGLFYEQDIDVSWTGAFTTAAPGRVIIQQFNNMIYLTILEVNPGPQSHASAINAGVVIPAPYRPLSNLFGLVRVLDVATQAVGSWTVGADGAIAIFNGLGPVVFTGSGNAGFDQITVVYTLT